MAGLGPRGIEMGFKKWLNDDLRGTLGEFMFCFNEFMVPMGGALLTFTFLFINPLISLLIAGSSIVIWIRHRYKYAKDMGWT